MRLSRLDLTRYGKFTDHSIDFGPAPEGAPDFHIVYGPNEAGKSTTMAGWLDLLFGIPAQSRMDFLHPYATMRLGAVLDTGAGRLDLIRTKGRGNTLTDAAGNPLPEAVVQGALAGIDRAGYQAMFSLDDDTLEAGGESILSSQGDLGQMLFTASSGLAEMSRVLDGLRAQAQGFFRPGGRSGGLSDLKADLKRIEEEAQALDTGARDFARLAQDRDRAEEVWSAAQATQDATVARLHLVERQLAALPHAIALRHVAQELAALPDLPPLPAGWAAELASLADERGQTQVRLEEHAAHLAALRTDLEAATDDPAMLAAAEEMAAVEALKSDYDGAMRDLPARRAEAQQIETRIADLSRRLGGEGRDPASLLPPAAVIARLRGLMEQRSGVAAALLTARQEEQAATRRLAELRAKLELAGGDPPDLAVLEQVAGAPQHLDAGAALERARAERAAADDRLAAQLARLAPWRGDAAALAALPVPTPAMLAGCGQRLAAARRDQERAAGEAARLGAEIARLEARLAAQADAGFLSLDEAAAIRAAREALWAAHRAALTPETAEAFEAALRRDDQVSAAQACAQTDALQSAEAQARLAELRIDLSGQEAARTAAQAALDAVGAELAAATPPGLPAGMTPEALEDWLRRRESALEAQAAAQEAGRAVTAATERVESTRAALTSALALAGLPPAPDAPLEVLLAQARHALERGRDLGALTASHAGAQEDLTRRRDALALANEADAAWQAAWQDACAATFMADAPPTAAAMGEVLDLLDALDRALTDLDKLRDRIAKMQVNQAAFEAGVRDLARRLGLPEQPVSGHWTLLCARMQAALSGQARRVELGGKLADAEAKTGALSRSLARIDSRLTAMSAHFGTGSVEDLRLAVQQAGARQDLTGQHDRLARDIREGLGLEHLDAALALLEGLDRPALVAERDRLAAAQSHQAQELQGLFADLSQARARIEAVGGDDAVARLNERRQTVLLRIEEEARDWLRRRLGIVAVDHALQSYRDSHRSAMMRRASEAFRTISRGAYTGLAAQPEGAREVLVALAAQGGSKLARDLSKGTRFQLYLALRVAGYFEIAGARPTVPFIADDIMETFDDDRSAEAFSLLAGMAHVGQVIYLTHHRHLCEIARQVCPGARVHELP